MASPINNTQAANLQLEAVRPALRPLFERSAVSFNLLKGKTQETSSRAMRVQLNIAPPGNFRQADLDGGDLGRGGGSQFIFGTVTPVDFVTAFEATKKADISSDSPKKASANPVRDDVKRLTKEMGWGFDALMQTPGTGQLSTMSSGAGTTTWTLGGNFKTKLLHRGLRVENYDSTFATKRAGVSTILAVNQTAGTVTVDAAPVGHTNTDLIVIEGLSGANPVSLFGIPAFQSDATSGTTLGLTRSLYPEIQTPSVDAGSSLLTPQHIRLAMNKLRLKRDDQSILDGLVAHLGPAQVDAYEQTAQLAILINKTDSSNQGYSPFFAPKDMLGAPLKVNVKADPTRIDFICTDRWFRALSQDIDFYSDPGDSETVFPGYGASGGRASFSLVYLCASFQVCSEDPGAGAYIKSLAVPSGY